MGFLKPDIEAREVRSQASPLSDELLKFLTGNLTGEGVAGGGGDVGFAQQGLRDFATARSTPEQFLELMGPLRAIFERQTEVDVAKTREGAVATGNRQSIGLAREEGRVRTESNTNLQALLSDLFLKEQSNLVNALGAIRQPFLDFAQLGINPDQTIISDSPFVQGAKTLADLAKGAGAVIDAV